MNSPKHVSTALCTLLATTLFLGAGCLRAKAAPEPKTEEQKTIYALGLMMGRNIGVFNLSPEELELVKAGLSDSISKKKPVVELETYGPKLDALARTRSTATAKAEKDKAKTLVDEASREPGAMKLPSGMVIRTIKPGTGASPLASDQVKVHYTGTLTDGTVFDSSVKRNEPATFPLAGVIKCWTEGLQKMKVGEKAKLTCPSDVAYGDNGRPPTIPGGATLIFEVELLEITTPKPVSASPPPPAMPPGHPPAGHP
jgi:FKBP-type peptidyl-prolyl cis-trans isomerase FkpA